MPTFYSPGVVQLFLDLPLDEESRMSANHPKEFPVLCEARQQKDTSLRGYEAT